MPSAMQPGEVEVADVDGAALEDRVLVEEQLELAESLAHRRDRVADLVDRTGRQVLARRRRGGCSALFIRRPVTISKIGRMRSRSRKPTVMTVVAPISMPPVPRATRWEVIRVSSIISTRITLARSGIWSVMPSSFSTARQKTASLNNGVR